VRCVAAPIDRSIHPSIDRSIDRSIGLDTSICTPLLTPPPLVFVPHHHQTGPRRHRPRHRRQPSPDCYGPKQEGKPIIRLNTEVVEARWEEPLRVWVVRTKSHGVCMYVWMCRESGVGGRSMGVDCLGRNEWQREPIG
jgi:hypothetical protein